MAVAGHPSVCCLLQAHALIAGLMLPAASAADSAYDSAHSAYSPTKRQGDYSPVDEQDEQNGLHILLVYILCCAVAEWSRWRLQMIPLLARHPTKVKALQRTHPKTRPLMMGLNRQMPPLTRFCEAIGRVQSTWRTV